GPQEVPHSAGPPWEERQEPQRDTVAPAIRARTIRARTGRWAQPRSTRARVVRPITAVGAMSPAPGPLPGSTHRGVLRRSETPMATSRPARDPRWPGPSWRGRDAFSPAPGRAAAITD